MPKGSGGVLKGLLFAASLCLFAVAGAATAAASESGSSVNPTLRVAADNTDVDHSDPALSSAPNHRRSLSPAA